MVAYRHASAAVLGRDGDLELAPTIAGLDGIAENVAEGPAQRIVVPQQAPVSPDPA